MVKTRSLYPTWTWIGTGSWQTDRRTVGRTDGQTENYDSWYALSTTCCRA